MSDKHPASYNQVAWYPAFSRKTSAPSKTRTISNDIQATCPGIITVKRVHHHCEQSKITMHLPQKEDLGLKPSDEDQTVQTSFIEREVQKQNGFGRRDRHDDSGYPGMERENSKSAIIRSLAKDVESLRAQLRSTQKELEEVKQRYQESETNLDALKKANSDLFQEIQKGKERESIYIEKAQRLAKDVEHESAAQGTENTILRERLRVSEDAMQRMAAVLREKTADLKGVQTFLSTADLYSGAEVISMVESLNTEFFQISAFTAELVEDEGMAAEEKEWSINRSNLVTALSNDAHFFAGDKLYAHIHSMSAQLRTDALPLQLALQALLSGWCMHHVRMHCWGPLHQKLDEIYRNIQSRGKETQAVSGRWRAITFANINEDYSETKRLFDVICNLLTLCGWSSSSAPGKKAATSIKEMLTSTQRQIVRLRKAVREGITTADLEVFGHTPGAPFQEKMMEDIYKTSTEDVSVEPLKLNRRILCTVGLGLRRRVGKDATGELPGQVDILLKPQIVLESILNDSGVAVPDV